MEVLTLSLHRDDRSLSPVPFSDCRFYDDDYHKSEVKQKDKKKKSIKRTRSEARARGDRVNAVVRGFSEDVVEIFAV